MSEGSRPGGLTALAVLNFIGVVFSAFFSFGSAVILVMMKLGPDAPNIDARTREAIQELEEIGMAVFYATFAVSLVSCVLLLLSGIGYLQQKKFLGRTLGNVWSLLFVAATVGMLFVGPPEGRGDFGLGHVVLLSYPVVTLILLNGTFKEDFVR